MNNKFKWTSLITGGVVLFMGATMAFSEPGSNNDPLVTMSYVNEKIDEVKSEVKSYVDTKINTSLVDKPNTTTPNNTGSNNLEVVELNAHQSIIGENGTEIILRAGNAVAIGSNLGGVSDVTAGKDIDTNMPIEKNHHLIIPRDDGRGVYSKGNTVFMVRGNYRIE